MARLKEFAVSSKVHTYRKREKEGRVFSVSRSILGGGRVRVATRRVRLVRGGLPLLLVRVAQLSVLVHEVVTGELAAADLAGVVLHV